MDVMEQEYPGTLERVRRSVQGLLDEGRLRPAVAARYPMEKAGDALASLENRTSLGKVIVEVRPA
jgi:NADPH:quinone reductase